VSESYGLSARQEKSSSVTSPAIMETPQPRHQSLRIVKSRRLKRAKGWEVLEELLKEI